MHRTKRRLLSCDVHIRSHECFTRCLWMLPFGVVGVHVNKWGSFVGFASDLSALCRFYNCILLWILVNLFQLGWLNWNNRMNVHIQGFGIEYVGTNCMKASLHLQFWLTSKHADQCPTNRHWIRTFRNNPKFLCESTGGCNKFHEFKSLDNTLLIFTSTVVNQRKA